MYLISKIHRPAACLIGRCCSCFCSWLVLVPLFSCRAFLLRLNQSQPPLPLHVLVLCTMYYVLLVVVIVVVVVVVLLLRRRLLLLLPPLPLPLLLPLLRLLRRLLPFDSSEAFTHRSFDTRKLLHTKAFTRKHFYTQALLHTEALTHRGFPRFRSKSFPQAE